MVSVGPRIVEQLGGEQVLLTGIQVPRLHEYEQAPE
jgi:hypothetical protein